MKNPQSRALKCVASELHLALINNALRFAAVQGGGAFVLKFVSLSLLWLLCLYAHAATLGVALDGSQPFTVIQEAIDASSHGDTILVYPGRYYENLMFNGKNIKLASLELLTGDRDYVYSTIIDGNQNGAAITANNSESHIHIQGFTVTNGIGYYDTMLASTFGGGVVIFRMSGERKASIVNCDITGNMANNGGGLSGSAINLYLSGVSIHSNIASSGGGIWFYGLHAQPYNANFDPVNRCNIYSNYAAFGSDLYFYNVNSVHVVVDTFTVANPWNFYATAVPSNPNISNPYTFDILNTVHEEVNHDLYVAPWGDDANSGLSPAQPMQSIFHAMYRIASDSENPKTVHVEDGRYSPSLNGQLFPIPIKSHTRLIGESREGTILDAENETGIISFTAHNQGWVANRLTLVNGKTGISGSRSEDYTVCDIKITDISDLRLAVGFSGYKDMGDINISNVSFSNVSSIEKSYVYDQKDLSGSLRLSNVEISSCEAPYMDAIYISSRNESDIIIDGLEVHNNRSTISDTSGFNSMFQISPYSPYGDRLRIEIKNSAFYDNYQGTNNHMAMARSLNDTLFISNCTFAGNSGGTAVLAVQGTNVLTNNVFHNPAMTTQILIPNHTSSGIYSPTTLINNNILGGSAGVYSETMQNPIYWGQGNTSHDPIFSGEGNRPYILSPGSPLIDAGWQAASGVISNSLDAAGNERYWDGDGDGITVIDLGAYEYQPIYSPINLNAELWHQQITLSWQMPVMDRGLSGYRIYRNNILYADIYTAQQMHFRDYSPVNDTLSYYVVAMYGNVESNISNTVTVIVSGVQIQDEANTPLINQISVFPNPFSDLAVIHYTLKKNSNVGIKIYNIRGQLVKTLIGGQEQKGEQNIIWDSCDEAGRYVAAGLYFLRFEIDSKLIVVKRLVLIK